MDWKEKMIKAMKDLHNACNDAPNWACQVCPFYYHCDCIEKEYNITPADNDFLEDV